MSVVVVASVELSWSGSVQESGVGCQIKMKSFRGVACHYCEERGVIFAKVTHINVLQTLGKRYI